MKKSDYWIITTDTRMVNKVVFDEKVTADEAKGLFLREMYEDILDEDHLGHTVVDVKPVGG